MQLKDGCFSLDLGIPCITKMSVKKGIIRGIIMHTIHMGDVLFNFGVYNLNC